MYLGGRRGLAVRLHGRSSWVIRVEQAPRSGRRCWRAGHSLGGKAVLQYLRGCAADGNAFPVPQQVCPLLAASAPTCKWSRHSFVMRAVGFVKAPGTCDRTEVLNTAGR
jgi:hypothetical protein